jgi:DNA-binding transcriptional MerR regulator
VNTSNLLAIGEVADSAGISVSAVRYYDDVGLVGPTTRVGGKRRFATDTIARVNFIRHAQDAGFTLDQIRDILNEEQGWRNLLDDKIAEIAERRARLDTMAAMLQEMRDCGCGAVLTCPKFRGN